MPLSYQRYTGNGTTTDFSISFQYLNRAHVVAKVNNSLVTHTWVNDSTLRISPAPATGSNVWIYRVTPKEAPLTVFKDGVGFREADLNRMVKQLLYISQEAYENADLPLLAEWREETLLAMQQTIQARTEALGYRDQCLSLVADGQSALDAYTASKIEEINVAVDDAYTAIDNKESEIGALADTIVHAIDSKRTAFNTDAAAKIDALETASGEAINLINAKKAEITAEGATALRVIDTRADEAELQVLALQTALNTMRTTIDALEADIPAIEADRQAAESAALAAGLYEAGAKGYMEQAGSYHDGILDVKNQTATIRDEAEAIRVATLQLKNDTAFLKGQADAAKIAAEGFKDQAYDYLLQTISRWNETNTFRDEAEGYKNDTAALASAVAEAAEAAFGAAAGAWVEGHVYNWPDVVAAPDGHTYRCIGTNITSIPTSFNPEWQVLTVIPPTTFELDVEGNLMPARIPVATGDWEIDADGNIMPRAS